MRRVKTNCRICISYCGIVVDVEDDQVVRVQGDREHPVTYGYTCSKGRALPNQHHHPRRLERPQKRVGAALVETTWDDVLDDLAGKLRNIIEESGPGAVGIFLGGGGYIDTAGYSAIHNIPRVLKTPSYYSDVTIDGVARYWVAELMCGIYAQQPQPDLENCKLVLFIGQNPMVSHGHTTRVSVPIDRLRQFRRQGEVWVIDPRRTETAANATRHVAPRPGTDYAILAYLVREILREGADREYLEKHAQDVDRLTEAVQAYTVEKASEISGVSAADLSDLLAAVRRAGRLMVDIGTGVTMARECNLVSWLSWALMIVTGSLDREGGGWFNPGLLLNLDKRDIPPAPLEGSRRPGPKSRPDLVSIAGEYPCVAIADEIEAGNLRALINLSANLVATLPGTTRTVAALKKLDVLATIEIIGNATTDISTHVLPTKDQMERADFVPDVTYPFLATEYAPAAMEAVGDRKSYWWILTQLGKRLGVEFLPGVDPDTASDDEVLGNLTKSAPVSFADLLDGEVHIHDPKPIIGWLQRHVDEKLGGWRLAPQVVVDQLKDMEIPREALVLLSRRQAKHQNSRMIHEETLKAILINLAEASRAGLKDGDRAIVRSDYGSLEGVVKIDGTLPDGVLNVPHGWEDDFNVNLLTGLEPADPLTSMAWLSGFPVSIAPAGG